MSGPQKQPMGGRGRGRGDASHSPSPHGPQANPHHTPPLSHSKREQMDSSSDQPEKQRSPRLAGRGRARAKKPEQQLYVPRGRRDLGRGQSPTNTQRENNSATSDHSSSSTVRQTSSKTPRQDSSKTVQGLTKMPASKKSRPNVQVYVPKGRRRLEESAGDGNIDSYDSPFMDVSSEQQEQRVLNPQNSSDSVDMDVFSSKQEQQVEFTQDPYLDFCDSERNTLKQSSINANIGRACSSGQESEDTQVSNLVSTTSVYSEEMEVSNSGERKQAFKSSTQEQPAFSDDSCYYSGVRGSDSNQQKMADDSVQEESSIHPSPNTPMDISTSVQGAHLEPAVLSENRESLESPNICRLQEECVKSKDSYKSESQSPVDKDPGDVKMAESEPAQSESVEGRFSMSKEECQASERTRENDNTSGQIAINTAQVHTESDVEITSTNLVQEMDKIVSEGACKREDSHISPQQIFDEHEISGSSGNDTQGSLQGKDVENVNFDLSSEGCMVGRTSSHTGDSQSCEIENEIKASGISGLSEPVCHDKEAPTASNNSKDTNQNSYLESQAQDNKQVGESVCYSTQCKNTGDETNMHEGAEITGSPEMEAKSLSDTSHEGMDGDAGIPPKEDRGADRHKEMMPEKSCKKSAHSTASEDRHAGRHKEMVPEKSSNSTASDEPTDSGDSASIIAASGSKMVKEGEEEEDEDSWDKIFDDNGDCLDPSAMEELTEHVGQVEISRPKKTINYLEFSPKDTDMDMTAYSHVIEISNFPPEFQTKDLLMAFKDYMSRGFDLKWVDDTTALGVFSSSIAAADALKMIHPMMQLKPMTEASKQSRSKAKRCQEFLQPYKPRPVTSAAAARRLVTGALGMTPRVSKEQRAEEHKVLKEAREKKKADRKQKEAIWDGNIGRCAMDDV